MWIEILIVIKCLCVCVYVCYNDDEMKLKRKDIVGLDHTYIEPLHDFNLIHYQNEVEKVSFYIFLFFIDNVIEIKWKWNCLVSSTLFLNLFYSTMWNIKDQMLN